MSRRVLEDLHREHPEWRPWLALLQPARQAVTAAEWDDAITCDRAAATGERPALAGAVITVDRRTADRWWRTVLGVADDGPAAPLARAAADLVDILEAAVNDDAARLGELAAAAGAPADAVRAVAGVAAMPILHACRRRVAHAAWRRGSCPVCGAWPALTEAQGLERSRHGRCARCGSDWVIPWLHCPFCGTDDHTRLRTLVSEVIGEARKVEACTECRGYVKTVMTLTPTPPADLALLDLATVDLDVVALTEGYTRPVRSDTALGARVVARERRRVLAWMG